MKKLNILALIIAFSCTAIFAATPNLKTKTDSLNYAFGIANGNGIKTYYLQNDSTGKGLESLLKGIKEGMKGGTKYPELAAMGTNIGNVLKEQATTGLMGMEGVNVNIEQIKQGLINGIRGFELEGQMTPNDAQLYVQSASQKMQEKQMESQFGSNREAGKVFLEDNAKKSDIITTESGLQYKIEKMGKGPKPTATDRVRVHYHGTLIDGTVFDSSVDRGESIVFGVNQVIKGWTEALELMPVGSKWKLYIPQELAYGSSNQGTIQPFSALIFDVELIGIEK